MFGGALGWRREPVGRHKIGQVDELEPGILEEGVAKKIGMNELGPPSCRQSDCRAMHHRIFHGPSGDLSGVTQPSIKIGGFRKSSPSGWVWTVFLSATDVEMFRAAVAQDGARRMHDSEQVPAIVQVIEHVAANVPVAAVISGLDIARPSIMAFRQERPADNAAALASNENAGH